jgi:hypothetical protein
MQTLGDDFLTMRVSEPNVFFSIFTQFKLGESSPAIQIVKESFQSIGHHDGKAIFDITNSQNLQFESKMNIKEILIPFIGSKLQIREIEMSEAFARILPSTVVLNHALNTRLRRLKFFWRHYLFIIWN